MHFSCRGNAFLGLVAPWRRVISLCTQCQAKDLCFFDPTCSGCQDLLLEWVISSPSFLLCAYLFPPSLPPSFLPPSSLPHYFIFLQILFPMSGVSHSRIFILPLYSHSHIHTLPFPYPHSPIHMSARSHSHIHTLPFPYPHHLIPILCLHPFPAVPTPPSLSCLQSCDNGFRRPRETCLLSPERYIHTYIHT